MLEYQTQTIPVGTTETVQDTYIKFVDYAASWSKVHNTDNYIIIIARLYLNVIHTFMILSRLRDEYIKIISLSSNLKVLT